MEIRKLTWREWERRGGCGLSQISEYMVAQKLGRDWQNRTIGKIASAWAPAGREIARFAREHLSIKSIKEVS